MNTIQTQEILVWSENFESIQEAVLKVGAKHVSLMILSDRKMFYQKYHGTHFNSYQHRKWSTQFKS